MIAEARTCEVTDPAAARQLVQRARAVARSERDHRHEGEALYRLASLAHYDGQPGDAFALATEAGEFAIAHELPLVHAWALHLIGVIHSDAGNYSEALALCVQALNTYRATGHRSDEGNILNTIATIHHELGDLDRAIVNYEAALAANSAVDRVDLDAITVANIATLRGEKGEVDTAVELGDHAVELCRDHAHGFLPHVLTATAEILSKRGGDLDHERARDALGEALRVLNDSTATFDDVVRAEAELALGRVEMRAGDFERALEHLEEAKGLAQVIGAPVIELAAISELATVQKRRGELATVVALLEAKCHLIERLSKERMEGRIRTLQIAHEAENSRRQSEIIRLKVAATQVRSPHAGGSSPDLG